MGVRSPGYPIPVTWSSLPGKPTAFPPAAHTHAWGDVTDKPATFPPATHSHAWGDVTDKPATFPPTAHTHSYLALTDRPAIPAATPLTDATPLALAATATPGTSTSAARGDHRHPLPSGLLQFVGNVTVSETLLLALGAGMRRKVFTLTGIATTDRLMYAAILPCAAGCEAMNVYPTAANEVTVSYNTPALGVGAVVSIPLAIYKVT